MKPIRRNSKSEKRDMRRYAEEAAIWASELQGLLSRPGKPGISVGEMVNVAVSMGFLQRR